MLLRGGNDFGCQWFGLKAYFLTFPAETVKMERFEGLTEKCENVVMCCIMLYPRTQGWNESGGAFDKVLCLCPVTDTWRIMDSQWCKPQWQSYQRTNQRLEEEQIVSFPKHLTQTCIQKSAKLAHEHPLHMQTKTVVLLWEEGDDPAARVLLSDNKAVTQNQTSDSTTECRASFLFIVAQRASGGDLWHYKWTLASCADKGTVQCKDKKKSTETNDKKKKKCISMGMCLMLHVYLICKHVYFHKCAWKCINCLTSGVIQTEISLFNNPTSHFIVYCLCKHQPDLCVQMKTSVIKVLWLPFVVHVD